MNPFSRALLLCVFLVSATAARADGPADNLAENVRRVPPPGIPIADSARRELESGVAELGRELDGLRTSLTNRPSLLELLPDAEVFHKAVHWALAYDEFYKSNEVEVARALLRQGLERTRALRDGHAPWTQATGLVVRAYASKIDGSIQPYGLIVPPSWQQSPAQPHRLDAWFHGRGENLTELSFINERQKSYGEFVPPNAFVLHLYGRYCNANKFAGEMDLFEALDHVKRHYRIDENRLVVRGFSMGGAACWQFAVHYAGLWAAAAPGAGFSETADFLKVFQNEAVKPAWYEQKLWHWYDCTDYARNLFHCPTVAYSGEIDRQKQAADMMARALAAEGLDLVHIIGPQTAHRYHPAAKEEINRRIDAIVDRGRDPIPRRVRLTTWTLRYNQMLWVALDGLEQHWERADVDAEIVNDHSLQLKTKNVSALTLSMPPGQCPLDPSKEPELQIDGTALRAPKPLSDRSWEAHFAKVGNAWQRIATADDGALRKRPGLQGPVDDAFMDSFLMARPTGASANPAIDKWVKGEMAHAVDHWRSQFRGDARIKDDRDVTDADIAGNNLILWGDPSSNQLLAKLADRLPIRWTKEAVQAGPQSFAGERHVPVMICPNPLNPKRYVVLNSGFTFREYDYLNNARQIAKLPDYAILDVSLPPNSRLPGGIATAGFFNEHWQFAVKGK